MEFMYYFLLTTRFVYKANKLKLIHTVELACLV